MIELYTAVVNTFNNSPSLAGITGGIFQDEAPAAQAIFRPYCILNDIRGKPIDRDFKSKLLEPYALQFSIHATPKLTCMQLAEALTAVFDSANLVAYGGALIALFNRRYPIITYVDGAQRDENSNKIWRSVCVYDAIVQDP